MGAVDEIDFIADVETQADRSEMAHQFTAGIEHAIHITAAQAVDAAEESSERSGSAIDTEIDEAALQRDEGLDGVMSDVKVSVNPSMNAWLKSLLIWASSFISLKA